jgi:hypothetical protein
MRGFAPLMRALTSIKTRMMNARDDPVRTLKADLISKTVFLVVSSGPFRNSDFIGPLKPSLQSEGFFYARRSTVSGR